MMEKNQIIEQIQFYIYERFQGEPTGHDYWHMERVAANAKYITEHEGGNPFITEVAAWLHDVTDQKLSKDVRKEEENLHAFLQSLITSEETLHQIYQAMKDISFSGNHATPESLEGRIVQDADRLDAIGAVGIARTFAYGGNREQLIHKESNRFVKEEDHPKTSIQHFYDKLLKLKDLLNTETAKEIAEERHQFMEQFLDQFYKEWKRPQ